MLYTVVIYFSTIIDNHIIFTSESVGLQYIATSRPSDPQVCITIEGNKLYLRGIQLTHSDQHIPHLIVIRVELDD